jgi:RIO kinase 2
VSSAEKAAQIITQVDNHDIRVLTAIELGMIKFNVVPPRELIRITGFSQGRLDFHLNRLYRNDLIYRQSDPYLGYLMNYTAYDLLALNAVVKAKLIDFLGPSIGVGKEADVFEGVTSEEVTVAVKFHRLGRTSFRDTKRKREYLAEKRHTSWLHQSRLAAEFEFKALQLMYDVGVSVPKPIHQNRHVIIMEFINGVQLSDIISLEDPEEFLMGILDNMKIVYKAGVIHTDLSEYNILIDEDGRDWIIDWPQYISKDHHNAEEILARDIGNVAYYFQRKHGTSMSNQEAVEYVKTG